MKLTYIRQCQYITLVYGIRITIVTCKRPCQYITLVYGITITKVTCKGHGNIWPWFMELELL